MCDSNEYREIPISDLIELLIECEKGQGVITLEEIKQSWDGLSIQR